MDNSIQDEVLAARIREIVGKLKADNNPEELERIKKIFKKNVPWSLRGYFAAYLIRQDAAAPAKDDRRRDNRAERTQQKAERKPREEKPRREAAEAPRREERQKPQQQPRQEAAERKPREPRQQRPIPEDAKTLYLNIGKMSRVYARDLVEMITDGTGISRDDVWLVRVHDKYSFVTLREADCEKAIAKLQGTEHRGRTIQINISTKDRRNQPKEAAPGNKEEKAAGDAAPAEAEAPVAEAPVVEEAPVQEAPAAVETPVAEAAVVEAPVQEAPAEAAPVQEEKPAETGKPKVEDLTITIKSVGDNARIRLEEARKDADSSHS